MKTNTPSDDTPEDMKDLKSFSDAFNKETDRGAVLIAASRIDEILESLLAAYLRETETAKDLLQGFSAPLSTFAARASAAHALGLIEDHEFEEITLVRKIRNEFSHKWKDIGFGTERVKAFCAQLPWLGPDSPEIPKTARETFNFVIIILLTDLLWRQRLVVKERRVARVWPNKFRRIRG